jgi:hypothetical protein
MININLMTWKMTNHWKTWKKRNAHCRIWYMARKLNITENENNTRWVVKYDEKYWKTWKMRNTKVWTWGIARKLKSWKMRNTHCRTWNRARNTQKLAKWEITTVVPGIWQEN